MASKLVAALLLGLVVAGTVGYFYFTRPMGKGNATGTSTSGSAIQTGSTTIQQNLTKFYLKIRVFVSLAQVTANCTLPLSGFFGMGSKINISALQLCSKQTFTKWQGSGIGNYTGTNPNATVIVNSNLTEDAYYGPTSTAPTTSVLTSTSTSTTTSIKGSYG